MSAMFGPLVTLLRALQRGGGMLAVSNAFIVTCYLVVLTDWRNTLDMLAAASAMAIGFYYLSSLAPRIPMDLVAPTLQAGTIDTSAATSEDLGGVTLLDLQRLEGLRHIGMLEELVNDYPPEIARLVARLERDVAGNDMPRSLETLHSLLGMSGEAGTAALYQMVRRVYVPMVENRHWPVDAGWLAQLKSLSVATGEALRAHSAAQTRTHSM